jgi:hypothetical protein
MTCFDGRKVVDGGSVKQDWFHKKLLLTSEFGKSL